MNATNGITKSSSITPFSSLGVERIMPNAARIAAAAFAMRNLWSGKTGGPVQVVSAPADVVARGKYLVEAADCAACNTAPGNAPFAGGLPMQSGFGTIYATNITPDPDNGIGRWSAEDFWRALHDGVRRDGRQLYPAESTKLSSAW